MISNSHLQWCVSTLFHAFILVYWRTYLLNVGKSKCQSLLHLHLWIAWQGYLAGHRFRVQGSPADSGYFSGIWHAQGYDQGPGRLQVHHHGDLRHQHRTAHHDYLQRDPQWLHQLIRLSLFRLHAFNFHNHNPTGVFAQSEKLNGVKI